jgi:hypothetical protein
MDGGSLQVLQASSTTKTGRHDIAEILLKVASSTKDQSINQEHTFRESSILQTSKDSFSEGLILSLCK